MERFLNFDVAGGGHGVRGEVGPRAGQAGGALQAVGDIGRTGVAHEQAPLPSREMARWITGGMYKGMSEKE